MDAGYQTFVSLVGDLGALGFVFFMTWRLANSTIPRLAKQFEDAGEKQRVDFKEILQEQRDTFVSMLEREQEVHGQHVTRIVESIKELKVNNKGDHHGMS